MASMLSWRSAGPLYPAPAAASLVSSRCNSFRGAASDKGRRRNRSGRRLLLADGDGCGDFIAVLVHGDARPCRLTELAGNERLGCHSVHAKDAHRSFDFLLAGEAHFFHPNSIIRLSKAFETSPKSSSSQKQ